MAGFQVKISRFDQWKRPHQTNGSFYFPVARSPPSASAGLCFGWPAEAACPPARCQRRRPHGVLGGGVFWLYKGPHLGLPVITGVRIRVPCSSVVYFSRGTLPPTKVGKRALLGDL